jgi:hypothetical protein
MMSPREKFNGKIKASFAGPVNGSLVIGNSNVQINRNATSDFILTNADVEYLQQQLAGLKRQVAADAPDEVRAPAIEQLDKLEAAILVDEPDLSAMVRVKGWFLENLPGFAGSVTSLIVNPIVGKLVEAAGDALASEFRRRS